MVLCPFRKQSASGRVGWLAALVALGGFAGAAHATGSDLDEAQGHVARAIGVLKGDGGAPSGHRKKALELLVRAQSELVKARQEGAVAPDAAP